MVMTDDRATEVAPSPPGDTLRETLAALDMSQAELARRTGISTKHINQITQGLIGISHQVALQLESALGIPARFWCALETEYQLHVLRHRGKQPVAKSPHDVVAHLTTAGLVASARLLDGMIPQGRP
jgi:addiction module HigA family antidote